MVDDALQSSQSSRRAARPCLVAFLVVSSIALNTALYTDAMNSPICVASFPERIASGLFITAGLLSQATITSLESVS